VVVVGGTVVVLGGAVVVVGGTVVVVVAGAGGTVGRVVGPGRSSEARETTVAPMTTDR
jgi:hypothetical protein